MARTELFATKQPGGAFMVADMGKSTGNRWFVGSTVTGATDGAGYGRNPDAPFATLDYAVGNCTANNGDVIYVMPNHAETVIAAGGLDLDVAGITVIGLGAGEDRPTITFTTADTADADVDAANVTLQNLVFVNGIDSQNIMLDVNADDCTVIECEFREGAATQFDIAIDLTIGSANGGDRLKVYNSRFLALSDGPVEAIELGEVNDGVEIVGCYIDGDFASAGIHNPTGKILTNLLIKDNVIGNRDSGEHAIELVSACTGFAIDNRLYGDTLGTILDPGSLMCLGNLETDAIDQAGVDSPRTSAGGFPADSITAAVIATGAIDTDAIAADTILGADNNNNTFASTNVVANADGSVIERQEYIQSGLYSTAGTYIPGLGYKVSKTEDVNTAATDDLFTVTGKVLVTLWTGEVTNALAAGVVDYALNIKTSGEAIAAATNLGSAVVGFMFVVPGDSGDGVLGSHAVSATQIADLNGKGMTNVIIGKAAGSCVLQSTRTAGDASDAIIHTLWYLPLEASAAVVAAA